MNIKLTDNTVLSPIVVTGENRFVQGSSRDTLGFVFPATEDMSELDSAFSSENCESITIVEDNGTENIYKGYTIRAELSKKAVEVTPATEEAEAVYEDRITVSMSQRTYAETQLASMTTAMNALCGEE